MAKDRHLTKKIIAKITKILLWTVGSVVGLLLLLCAIMCIPSVQTYTAMKVTAFLSQKMQSEVSVDKLRIGFDMSIVFENLQLKDQRSNNLIYIHEGELAFPTLDLSHNYIGISYIKANQADVCIRTYEGDTAINMKFFIDFVKPKKSRKEKIRIDLQNITLTDSRFCFRNDNKALPDEDSVWNYANMVLDKINIRLRQLLIISDSLNFEIDNLLARERSGFEITYFKGYLRLSKSGIYCFNTDFTTASKSHILTDFGMDYSSFKDFSDFIKIVKFNTILYPSELNTHDLRYFAPKLAGLNNWVKISSSKVSGTVEDLKTKELSIELGDKTYLKGDIAMMGLPNIKETFFDINIDESNITVNDLINIQLPNNKQIPINNKMRQLQWVQLKGDFLGLYDNFFADAHLASGVGSGACELMFNSRQKPITYDGKMSLYQFKAGQLFDIQDVGNITCNAQIKGKGLTVEDMDFALNGVVNQIEYRQNELADLHLEGKFLQKMFSGKIVCDDKDLDLDFNGTIDFNQQQPQYDFEADVRALNISNFHFFRPDSNVIFSGCISSRLEGNSLENLNGTLSMEEIVYQENNQPYFFPNFKMNITADTIGYKNLQLQSDALNANLDGFFTYKDAISLIQKRLQQYLPDLIPISPAVASVNDSLQKEHFKLSVELKRPLPILALFLPKIQINSSLTAELAIDEREHSATVSATAKRIEIAKILFDNLSISGNEIQNQFKIHALCDGLYVSVKDSFPTISNIDIQTSLQNNSINFLMLANGNSQNRINNILTEGKLQFLKNKAITLNLNNGSVVWDNETFFFDSSNYVYYSPDSIFVQNIGLSAASGKSLRISSQANRSNPKGVGFEFNEIELGLFNVFLERYQIELQGKATGRGGLSLNTAAFGIGSSFQIKDLYFNDVAVGYLEGRTGWRDANKKLNINATIYQTPLKINQLLNISGYIDPVNKYLDFKGDIDSLNIHLLHRYLASFASKTEGYGKGKVTFSGAFSDPKLNGEIALSHAILGIDYLKTEYFIEKGNINFVDTGFIFSDIQLSDHLNGTGTVNGVITHKKLKDFGLNLKIKADNLLALKTTAKDNNRFYGKAFANGNVSITGKASEQIRINAEVTTQPQTDITLSLDWAETSSESNFITFVAKEDENLFQNIDNEQQTGTSMAVNLIITATQDAVVRVLLDPSIGGTILPKGSGVVELQVDENYDFNLYGRYNIVGGEFDLAFYDLLTRSFKLENGSYISWNGDPMQGTINLRAMQSAKVLDPLANTQTATTSTDPNDPNATASNSTTSVAKQRIAINNIITLTGQLLKPDFKFSFELPNTSEDNKSLIYSMIDTSDRQSMVEQMVSILFLGTLTTQNNTSASGSNLNSSLNSGIGYSLSEILSYQINKLASGISNNLDVRVAYLPGETFAEGEYSLDVGSSFLNDKLTISSSVGMIDRQDIATGYQFLIDFVAEYKLNKDGSLKAKGFNTTNQQDYFQSAFSSSKYTQGIGLSYSKDFDKFKDIFVRKPKKKKKGEENIDER
ncbi:MAG: translocation/assembly module TamB [Bacteroidales bacterium]|nr:translocation/assembly module TamB [Bacteroidales bacterium]